MDCRLTRTSRVSRFWSVGRSSVRVSTPPSRATPTPSGPLIGAAGHWLDVMACNRSAGARRRHLYCARREAMTDIPGDAASREAGPDRAGDGLLSPVGYTRDDESPDDRFYSFPRRVVHIDDGAIAALGRLYAEVLPTGGRLLDLMSSWRSHLPSGFTAREVVGLGLNADEMADNPQLTSHVVHDVKRHHKPASGRRARNVARVAAVAPRDLTNQRQPQPGPGALAAAGKSMKGLEHPLALGVGNAGPVIADA